MSDYTELKALQKELREANDNLTKMASRVKKASDAEIQAELNFRRLSNLELVNLFAEEVESKKERTIAHREAIIATKFENEYCNLLMAKANKKTELDLWRGLKLKIESLRTLISVEKEQIRL